LARDLLLIVPALALIFYTASEQRRHAALEAQEATLRLARLASTDQEQLIAATRQLLVGVAQLPEVRRRDPHACNSVLANLREKYPLYANFGATYPNGDILCSALPMSRSVNTADRVWFGRAVRTYDFTIGDYQIGRFTRKATINFGYPVLTNEGQLWGVVFAELDLSWLKQFVGRAQLPEGSVLDVIDRNGTILVRYPDPEEWVGKPLQTPIVDNILTRRTGIAEAAGVDGVPRFFGFTPLLGTSETGDVYVSIGIPQKSVFAKTHWILARNFALLALGAVMLFMAAWVGADLFMLRQVKGLLTVTKKLRSGDLNARSGLRYGKDELSEVAQSVDQMAESLARRTLELENANRAKDEFLRVMSHELRTPLSTIMGYTGITKEALLGPINPRQQEALQRALKCSNELMAMINSILEVTRIEGGAISVGSQEIHLGNFLNDLRSNYDLPLDKEIVLLWDYPSDLPVVKTDGRKLKHILQNLINNAIKFTEKGHVTLSARYVLETMRIEFKVADTGIGIPKEKIPVIFEMFRQVEDSSKTRSYGGMGIGLYIVQKFTEMLGGKVEVESEPGKGSVFTVMIPYHDSHQRVNSAIDLAYTTET
jgi:signal transduction histidine kinase